MTRLATLVAVVAIAALGLGHGAQAQPPTGTATLNVYVTGFEEQGGELALALFDSESTYDTRENAVRKEFVPVIDGEAHWTVESLPLGRRYVVIAYHDENGNRELDTRIMGIPKEKVGLSNNVRGRFGPPRFDKASFALDAPETRIHIRLQ